MTMKLINSRGRILLEVESCRIVNGNPIYIYSGPGCGGCVDRKGLDATVAHIQMDAPSAKRVGALPEPTGAPIIT